MNKGPAWSPDSRGVAYTEGRRIKVVPLADRTSLRVKTGLGRSAIDHLSWSPDGSRLVFIEQHGGGPELWLIGGFLHLVNNKR